MQCKAASSSQFKSLIIDDETRAQRGFYAVYVIRTDITRRYEPLDFEIKGLRKTIFLHVFGFQVCVRAASSAIQKSQY